jgi:hypothetical protein
MLLLVTEGERRVQSYGIICGDDDISNEGHGYIVYKKKNSQEVHCGEGFHRVCFYVIWVSVREDNLEAEAFTRQKEHKLADMVIVVSGNFLKDEGEFGSIVGNNVLAEAGIFSVFLKRFNRARVFVWLMQLLLISEASFLAGSGFSTRRCKEREFAVRGSVVHEFLLRICFKCKNGMKFVAVMPFNDKHLYSTTINYNLPAFGLPSFFAFNKSRGFKSNLSFTT